MAAEIGEILPGLWRFEAAHPDWTQDEGGEDGWGQIVAWWVLATARGMLLIDPLVLDWAALDQLLGEHGGCAGIVRTVHWHQRTISEVAARYGVEIWAKRPPDLSEPLDHDLAADGDELWDGIRTFATERGDEVALWLPSQSALLFGDVMLRRDSGELRICPESWLQPAGGRARLRALLGELTRLPVEHLLVSHGPLVLGDGAASLRAALA